MADAMFACLDLLDRHVVDADDEPVGKVEDVELEAGAGTLRVRALLVGPHAFGHRLGGPIGRWVSATASRLSGISEPIRLPLDVVDEMGVLLKLNVRAEDIERVHRVDHWLRDRFIGRIPGSHHASE